MNRRQFITTVAALTPALITSTATLSFASFLDDLTDVVPDEVTAVFKSGKKIVSGFDDITPEQEHYLGRSVAAVILSRYPCSQHRSAQKYVNLLGQSLAQVSDRPETFGGYHFLVLDSDEINALSAPGGFIFVTKGLIRCCKTEDAMAAILAHEIGHVQRRHGLQAIQESRITDGVTTLAIVGTSTMAGGTLGGERRELTIFFSDLEGFTAISEGLSPEELTGVLNDYLTAMTDIIQETGGTVDKYEGDAIIAFWNAPVDQPDHALRGVTAALRCQEKLSEMRPGLKKQTGREFRMRIGLNTGPAVVGNLGSHTRFDYTMLGDPVNLAARLESANKQFGTYTMLSQSTLDRLDDRVPVRELSRLRVVGKSEAVTVYEPMAEADILLRQETMPHFAKGLELFYAGDFAKAVAYFAVVAEKDSAAAAYLEKCKELQVTKPKNWDGVWTMTRK